MSCIHGLNENNCPVCRISNSTSVNNQKKLYLKIKSPLELLKNRSIEKDNTEKSRVIESFGYKSLNSGFKSSPIDLLKPKLINTLPNYKNRLFLKRLKELDLSNSDKLGLPKRVKLRDSSLLLE